MKNSQLTEIVFNISLLANNYRRSELKLKLNSVALIREQTTRPSDRCLLAKLVPIFADRFVALPAQRIPTFVYIGFLDRSRYFSFK
jgi:hypothetical protein